MMQYIKRGNYRVYTSKNGDNLNNHQHKEEYVRKSVFVVYDKSMQNTKEYKGRTVKSSYKKNQTLEFGSSKFELDDDTDVIFTGSMHTFNTLVKKLN